jgi:hypothetical protein
MAASANADVCDVRVDMPFAAVQLTPVIMRLFDIAEKDADQVNIRFHSYAPTDFAVGGRLLADVVPRIAQWMKRISG